jgi:hypothetical protein
MLHIHLVEVIASLFVWHDNETKHFFAFQLLKASNSAARKIPEQFQSCPTSIDLSTVSPLIAPTLPT